MAITVFTRGTSAALTVATTILGRNGVPHHVIDVETHPLARFADLGARLASAEGKRGWALERDPMPLECSVPGVFAAGDLRSGSVKRVASAVGEGAMAVQLVHRFVALQ